MMRIRTLAITRSVGIAIVAIVALAAPSCSGTGALADSVAAKLSAFVKGGSTFEDDVASGLLRTNLDEEASEIGTITKNLDSADLTAAEAQLVRDADAWAIVYSQVDDIVLIANKDLSVEAKSLVNQSQHAVAGYKLTDEVVTELNLIAENALESAACELAHSTLSPADQEEVSDLAPDYTQVGSTVDQVVEYVDLALAPYGDPRQFDPYLDKLTFAKGVIDTANSIVESVQGVIEAPNATVARAHIYYLQACVLKSAG